jgi:hypothetical protein
MEQQKWGAMGFPAVMVKDVDIINLLEFALSRNHCSENNYLPLIIRLCEKL